MTAGQVAEEHWSGLAIEDVRAKIVSYHQPVPEHCELAHRGQIDTFAASAPMQFTRPANRLDPVLIS
jgi:hypothetical protein